MKHRLVPGSAAGCALHSLRRGLLLLPKPTVARHVVRAIAAGSCGATLQTRPSSSSTSRPPFTTLPSRPPSLHPQSSSLEQPLPMGEQLRHMMRLLPHSVLVCTSFRPSQTNQPRGMTVSSFTSLSLSPAALVTFHVATPSRTLDAIRASGVLNFHVLSGDEAGAGVAAHFTSGNHEHVFSGVGLRGAGLRVRVREKGDGDGKEHAAERRQEEAPVLEGEGVMYVLRCRLFKEAPQGGVVMVRDHAIVVAEVVEIIETSGRTEEGHESFGLVYADRHYRGLGETFVRCEGGGEDVLSKFEETGADSD